MDHKEELLVKRVVINPNIKAGKPTIRGTRIPVALILELLAEGWAHQDMVDEYPNITEQDILACLLFACKAIEKSSYMPLPA